MRSCFFLFPSPPPHAFSSSGHVPPSLSCSSFPLHVNHYTELYQLYFKVHPMAGPSSPSPCCPCCLSQCQSLSWKLPWPLPSALYHMPLLKICEGVSLLLGQRYILDVAVWGLCNGWYLWPLCTLSLVHFLCLLSTTHTGLHPDALVLLPSFIQCLPTVTCS